MLIALTSRLSGGYVAMHEIDLDRAGRKICCNCVGKIVMGVNPEKLKNVGHITVYRTDDPVRM